MRPLLMPIVCARHIKLQHCVLSIISIMDFSHISNFAGKLNDEEQQVVNSFFSISTYLTAC